MQGQKLFDPWKVINETRHQKVVDARSQLIDHMLGGQEMTLEEIDAAMRLIESFDYVLAELCRFGVPGEAGE